MSNTRVIIEHKDGRRFSVTPAVHQQQYPDFKVVGDETPESFVATGIPKPKRIRKRPAAKAGVSTPPVELVSEGNASIDSSIAEGNVSGNVLTDSSIAEGEGEA